jgi:hypothetical protein
LSVECDKHHVFEISLDNIKENCPYCSRQRVWKGETDLWTTHPHIAKLLKNKEDGYKYMYGTKTKLDFICPLCGTLIHKIPSLVLDSHGNVICICSDGFSYPEKFIYNFLKQTNIDFIYQLSKKDFKWCDKYRYDFYLKKYNLIIEVHGRQHYDSVFFDTPENVHKNDSAKQELALKNGCNYCVIDARVSEKNYIIQSIYSSALSNILDLSLVDWAQCEEFASKSILYEVIDIWNNDTKNVQYISKKLGIADTTTYHYLEKGNDLNLCNFDRKSYAYAAKVNAHKNKLPVNAKSVKSVETGIIYKSFAEAKQKCNAYLTREIVGNPNRTSAKQHWIYI